MAAICLSPPFSFLPAPPLPALLTSCRLSRPVSGEEPCVHALFVVWSGRVTGFQDDYFLTSTTPQDSADPTPTHRGASRQGDLHSGKTSSKHSDRSLPSDSTRSSHNGEDRGVSHAKESSQIILNPLDSSGGSSASPGQSPSMPLTPVCKSGPAFPAVAYPASGVLGGPR